MITIQRYVVGAFWGVVALALGVAGVTSLGATGARNSEYIAVNAALAEPGRVTAAATRLASAPADLAIPYARGLLAARVGDRAAAQTAWVAALDAAERYVPLVRQHALTDLALAQRAVDHYPANATAMDWLGDALSAAHQPGEALAWYRRAVERQPEANLVWEKIGLAAETQNQPALALQATRTACDLNAQRNGMCFMAARLAYTAGDWATTIHYFERGHYPEQIPDWVLMIRAAQKLDRLLDADRYLAMAQARRPANYPALLRNAP